MTTHVKAGLVALIVLGGCTETTSGSGKFRLALPMFKTTQAPEQVRVSGNDVVIKGPHGFCIDPTETKDKAKSAFVVLGSCAAISNNPIRSRPAIPAILMATVSGKTDSAPIAASATALGGFFGSDAGRKALSRDGRAETVTVIETLERGGAFYIHARDSSTDTLAGAGEEYWRALFNIKGRIISASVVSLKDAPISTTEGFDTLGAFIAQIRAVNLPDAVLPAKKETIPPFLKRLFNKEQL